MRKRKSTEEHRRETADATLVPAIDHGMSMLTTAAIARSVGPAEGTIFRHFGTKVETILAAMSREVRTTADAVNVAVARQVARPCATQAAALDAVLWPQVAPRLRATVANPNERYFPAHSEWNASCNAALVVSGHFNSLARVHEARVADAAAAAAPRRPEALAERTRVEAHRQQAAPAGAVAAVAALRESVVASARALALADTEVLFRAGRAALTEVLDRQGELERPRLDLLGARVEACPADARWRRWTAGLAEPSRESRNAHKTDQQQ